MNKICFTALLLWVVQASAALGGGITVFDNQSDFFRAAEIVSTETFLRILQSCSPGEGLRGRRRHRLYIKHRGSMDRRADRPSRKSSERSRHHGDRYKNIKFCWGFDGCHRFFHGHRRYLPCLPTQWRPPTQFNRVWRRPIRVDSGARDRLRTVPATE